MDMLGRINCELNDSDVSEVTEDCLSNASNEADQTIVNRHTNQSYVTISSSTSSIRSVSTDTIIDL